MITSTPSEAHRRRPPRIGDVIYAFTTVDSTNVQASKLFHPRHGTLVLADYQTAGRGQIGRTWYSAPNANLLLSVILYPGISASAHFSLNMMVSLAVQETVRHFCPEGEISVKWPNDVYAGDRKIAGILVQNTIQGDRITSSIAGIGLNVHETHFPSSLPNPISLHQLITTSGRIPPDRKEVLASLTGLLEARADLLEPADRTAVLREDYHRVLYKKDQRARFSTPGDPGAWEGIIRGTDHTGRLIIETSNGKTRVFAFREVEMLL